MICRALAFLQPEQAALAEYQISDPKPQQTVPQAIKHRDRFMRGLRAGFISAISDPIH